MSKIGSFFGGVPNLIRESVRPRTEKDYRILIAPRDEDGEKSSRYPWLFIRVFALLLVLLAVSCVINSLTYEGRENLFIVGSMLIALPFLILIYEAFPKRTLGLLSVLLVAFTGGLLSILVFWRDIIDVPDELVLHPFCVGIFEELWKAVPTVAAILLLKKKNATDGLIIGAAVGTGFGIIENLLYLGSPITVMSADFPAYFYCVLERNTDMIVTHIFWSALIGYAFLKFGHAWRNPKFYGCVLYSMAAHGVWDYLCDDFLPDFLKIDVTVLDSGLSNYIGWTAITVGEIVAWFIIMISERRGAFPEEEDAPVREKFGFRHLAVLSLAVFTCVSSVFACLYLTCHEKANVRREELVCVGTMDEFIADRQMGREIVFEEDRPFDPDMENLEEIRKSGKLVAATQCVPGRDGEYFVYEYRFDGDEEEVFYHYAYEETDEETGEKSLLFVSICIIVPLRTESGDAPEGETEPEIFAFYDLKSDLGDYEDYHYEYLYDENGLIYYETTVRPSGNTFVSGVGEGISLSLAAASLAAGIVLFTVFSVKAKRQKTRRPPAEVPNREP